MEQIKNNRYRSTLRFHRHNMSTIGEWTEKANKAIQEINTSNIAETNLLIYATATDMRWEEHPWKNTKRIKYTALANHNREENNYSKTSEDLHQLGAANPIFNSIFNVNTFFKNEALSTQLKAQCRLTVMAHKSKQYKTRNEQYCINKIFSSTPGRAYREPTEKQRTGAVPEKWQCEQCWKEIWSDRRRRSEEIELTASWGHSTEQSLTEITKTEVQEKLKKMSNWKAPGSYQAQVF